MCIYDEKECQPCESRGGVWIEALCSTCVVTALGSAAEVQCSGAAVTSSKRARRDCSKDAIALHPLSRLASPPRSDDTTTLCLCMA